MANQAPEPTDDSTAPQEETTFAGNRPLTTRWWWSPVLMVVVGVAVIGYQVSAYTNGGGMWMNAVMIAIGAAVAVAGLVSLWRAYPAERAKGGTTPPPA